MLTEAKINKLRELAERGIGGEMETAKRILTRHGIDWRKPKKTIFSEVLTAVRGAEEIKEFKVNLRFPSDLLLLRVLYYNLSSSKNPIKMDGIKAIIKCTKSEADRIAKVYNNEEFASEVNYILLHTLVNVFK